MLVGERPFIIRKPEEVFFLRGVPASLFQDCANISQTPNNAQLDIIGAMVSSETECQHRIVCLVSFSICTVFSAMFMMYSVVRFMFCLVFLCFWHCVWCSLSYVWCWLPCLYCSPTGVWCSVKCEWCIISCIDDRGHAFDVLCYVCDVAGLTTYMCRMLSDTFSIECMLFLQLL